MINLVEASVMVDSVGVVRVLFILTRVDMGSERVGKINLIFWDKCVG